jgi:hypothetical protein
MVEGYNLTYSWLNNPIENISAIKPSLKLMGNAVQFDNVYFFAGYSVFDYPNGDAYISRLVYESYKDGFKDYFVSF